jgi:hypothetical protein
MNDTDKINAMLDDMELYRSANYCKLEAALRIAVKGLERCQKRTLHAKNTIWAVAEALERKP